jgi:hypothetical protein
MAKGTVRVYEVVYSVDDDSPAAHGGPAGDGSFVWRSRSAADAAAFARTATYYGRPATVSWTDAPRRTAERWGCA